MSDSTKAIGVWVDPVMEYTATCTNPAVATVQQTVRQVSQKVVNKVKDAYCIDLSNNMMKTSYYPEVPQETILEDIGENPLLVLVKPEYSHAERVKHRFRDLQKSDEMTSVILNELKGNSESETSASSSVGDSAHKFVDLFRGLQQDVKEMKAELVLGKAEKIQEQEVHKAELSKLATLLMLEQEDRKVELSKLATLLILEQEDRKAECEKLTYQITKLKKEKKVVQTRLKLLEEVTEKQGGDLETLESSLQQCKKDLAESIVKAKAQQHADMQAISELTVKLIPIHLRVLLDRGREKILKYLLYETWDDLSRAQAQGENNSLSDMIMQGLGNIQHGLSQEAVKFLCTYDNIRRDGNHFAHASEAEIKNAVETKSICSQERRFLEQLYEFVFNVSV